LSANTEAQNPGGSPHSRHIHRYSQSLMNCPLGRDIVQLHAAPKKK
jgi:hypothetical protein